MRKILENFLAIPNMIAASENFGASSKQFLGEPRRDPKSRRGILAVSDAKIHAMLLERIRQPIVNYLPPRRSNNVTDK